MSVDEAHAILKKCRSELEQRFLVRNGKWLYKVRELRTMDAVVKSGCSDHRVLCIDEGQKPMCECCLQIDHRRKRCSRVGIRVKLDREQLQWEEQRLAKSRLGSERNTNDRVLHFLSSQVALITKTQNQHLDATRPSAASNTQTIKKMSNNIKNKTHTQTTTGFHFHKQR